jgi:hypothetical protein
MENYNGLEDDYIIFKVNALIIDELVLDDGYNLAFSARLYANDDDLVANSDNTIQILRTNTEKPDLNFQTQLHYDDTNTIMDVNSTLPISFILSHKDTSMAECINIIFALYYPSYIKFKEILEPASLITSFNFTNDLTVKIHVIFISNLIFILFNN